VISPNYSVLYDDSAGDAVRKDQKSGEHKGEEADNDVDIFRTNKRNPYLVWSGKGKLNIALLHQILCIAHTFLLYLYYFSTITNSFFTALRICVIIALIIFAGVQTIRIVSDTWISQWTTGSAPQWYYISSMFV
jgi:hypothetical protein